MNNTQETCIAFIKKTFTDTHKSTAVIGLSGGIDSAISLFLTAKALGPEHIQAFSLPSRHSNPIHQQDAQAAALAAGLTLDQFHILPIGSIIQKEWRIINKGTGNRVQGIGKESCRHLVDRDPGFQRAIIRSEAKGVSTAKPIDARNNKLRLANLAARTRMLVLYDQAKHLDALVIGTENRSESLLGYFTRFGDEASDLEPIRHLFKTEVIELAKNLGVPQSIIDKSPTADLWPGQTDATELGFTYAEADPILMLLEKNQTTEQIIAAGHSESLVNAVTKQVNASAFKHQVPYHI